MQTRRRLVRKTRVDAGMEPRRRLTQKTTVGHLAVELATVALVVNPTPQPTTLAWQDCFLAAEDLGQETDKRKCVYLATLPHPRTALANGVENLRCPGEFDRHKVAEMFLDIFSNPMAADAAAMSRGRCALVLEEMAIFQEKHAVDMNGQRHIHYHVALRASSSFRFAAYKHALRLKYGLASHWSDSHDGYWSAVRYGYIPTPKKPQSELDSQYVTWGRLAPHKPLFETSQEPVTASATKRKRELAVKKASEEGRPAPRARENDLYAVIVAQGIKNTPDDTWADKRLISYLKQNDPQLWQLAFRMRARLSSLIDDVWSWETVDDELALLGQSRLERVQAASSSACICQSVWRQRAEWILEANALDKGQFCADILRSITHGRHENIPVVALVGKHGGEGKSFLLSPLRQTFGPDYVQETPQPGSFPLMGLEKKRIALLDEWECDD